MTRRTLSTRSHDYRPCSRIERRRVAPSVRGTSSLKIENSSRRRKKIRTKVFFDETLEESGEGWEESESGEGVRAKSGSVKWRLLRRRAMVKSNCEAIKSELNRRVSHGRRAERSRRTAATLPHTSSTSRAAARDPETSGPRFHYALCNNS